MITTVAGVLVFATKNDVCDEPSVVEKVISQVPSSCLLFFLRLFVLKGIREVSVFRDET